MAAGVRNGVEIGKKKRLLQLLGRPLIVNVLERLPRRRCLIVLNYHRIGDPHRTEHDRGVFAATESQFAQQVEWLHRTFRLLRLEEAEELVDRQERIRHAHVLITFDDGYRDNYDTAFPILRGIGAPATFFLPTGLIGTSTVPWWDQVALLVRRNRRRPIVLEYPRHVEVDGDDETVIRRLLSLYKEPTTVDSQRFLAEVGRACGDGLTHVADERVFLDWDEAREMVRGGMSFGSHAHSHEILSRQSEATQRDELERSRAILKEQLAINTSALAYPVGSPGSFSAATRRALHDTGYRTAFSYYGGINLPGEMDRFNVLRIKLDLEGNLQHFRFRTLFQSTSGLDF